MVARAIGSSWHETTPGQSARLGTLCRETRSREIMAVLVNDVVADALRLGLYDTPEDQIVKAKGAPFRPRLAG
jgi:hypothetical protein